MDDGKKGRRRRTAAGMLRQERDCLIRLPGGLQHRPAHDLHGHVIPRGGGQLLDRLHGLVRPAQALLRQGADGRQVRLRLALHIGDNVIGLSQSDPCPKLEHASGERIFGGEGGCIEIDYFLVLALVEVVVDIDQFAFCRVRVHPDRERFLPQYFSTLFKQKRIYAGRWPNHNSNGIQWY